MGDAINSTTWDMVSEELGATLLILGVRRRQSLIGGGLTPVVVNALRLNPGKERLIVEPMEQARTIYDQLDNPHQVAAANYQLALFYSKVWTCQRDEVKTREKLSEAFRNFGAAHHYFFTHMNGNEPTFVILSLDLSNLYSAVSGELDCLRKAFLCCLDTCNAFLIFEHKDTIEVSEQNKIKEKTTPLGDNWSGKMKTLAISVEERVLKLLLNLVKIEKDKNKGSKFSNVDIKLTKFKALYGLALDTKISLQDCVTDSVDSNHKIISAVYHLLIKLKTENKKNNYM